MDMLNQSMYNHNKAQQSKNRVHISWDKLYGGDFVNNSNARVAYWYLKSLLTRLFA